MNRNILYVFIVALLVLPFAYIEYYFGKKYEYRAHEECLETITNEGNWNTRKGTVDYCKEQTQ